MPAQLLLPALFLSVLPFTVFLQVLLQRRQSEAPREVGPTKPPVRRREPTRSPSRMTGLGGTSLPELGGGATQQPVPWRLGSRREARRAIVLMTIFEPCRALQQPDPP